MTDYFCSICSQSRTLFFQLIFWKYSQTCVCTTTTIGTPNLWLLLTGSRCTKVCMIMLWRFKKELQNGCRCKQVVVIRRWSLARVWLYFVSLTFYWKLVKTLLFAVCVWELNFISVCILLYTVCILTYVYLDLTNGTEKNKEIC